MVGASSTTRAVICLLLLAALSARGQSLVGQDRHVELVVSRTTATSILVEVDDATARIVRTSPAWTIESSSPGTHRGRFVEGESVSGSHHALLVGRGFVGEASVSLVQRLRGPLTAAQAHDVSAHARGDLGNLGRAWLHVEYRQADGEAWRNAFALGLSGAQRWRRANGTFLAPEAAEWRVRVELRGEGLARIDSIHLAEQNRPDVELLTDPDFEGGYHWRLQVRTEGATGWLELPAVIHESRHNVIDLRPDTVYELRGLLVSAAGRQEGITQPVRAQTQSRSAREWRGLTLREQAPMRVPSGSFPCIEAFGDSLLLTYALDGEIMLSRLTETLEVIDTQTLVPAYVTERGRAFQGQLQTCVIGDRLYVSYKRDHEPFVASARLCVIEANLRTGQVRGPAVIESARVDRSPWNGGIAQVHGQLWVVYADTKLIRDVPHSEIAIRRFDPRTMEPDPFDQRLVDAPSAHLFAPTIESFGDSLAVFFSDMAGAYRPSAAGASFDEPLYVCLFDGRRFTSPQVVSDAGRNRYAQALDLGDRLLAVWKYGTPYDAAEWGEYMFHDIGLALIDPVSGVVEATSYVDDIKYNSSPDVALLKGRAIVVSTKHEHLYGLEHDPAEQLGIYAGWLDLGRWAL